MEMCEHLLNPKEFHFSIDNLHISVDSTQCLLFLLCKKRMLTVKLRQRSELHKIFEFRFFSIVKIKFLIVHYLSLNCLFIYLFFF